MSPLWRARSSYSDVKQCCSPVGRTFDRPYQVLQQAVSRPFQKEHPRFFLPRVHALLPRPSGSYRRPTLGGTTGAVNLFNTRIWARNHAQSVSCLTQWWQRCQLPAARWMTRLSVTQTSLAFGYRTSTMDCCSGDPHIKDLLQGQYWPVTNNERRLIHSLYLKHGTLHTGWSLCLDAESVATTCCCVLVTGNFGELVNSWSCGLTYWWTAVIGQSSQSVSPSHITHDPWSHDASGIWHSHIYVHCTWHLIYL